MLSTATKIRIARMLYLAVHGARRLAGAGDRVSVRRHGVRWELDLREGIDLTIYCVGAFERETLSALESLVQRGSTVLDVGANVGAHTLHLARLVGESGRVIAFEPTDFAVAKLRANLAVNPELSSRVDVFQVFLAEEDGAALAPALASSWPVDGRPPDDVQMGSRSMSVASASARTLDSVLAGAGNPEIGLMKMDVDGHELEVLKGARGLLERSRPLIVMELAPYVFHPRGKFDELVALLADQGYGFRPLGSPRPLPGTGPALRKLVPEEGSLNVIAAPGAVG